MITNFNLFSLDLFYFFEFIVRNHIWDATNSEREKEWLIETLFMPAARNVSVTESISRFIKTDRRDYKAKLKLYLNYSVQ